jgi:hypothetical protein
MVAAGLEIHLVPIAPTPGEPTASAAERMARSVPMWKAYVASGKAEHESPGAQLHPDCPSGPAADPPASVARATREGPDLCDAQRSTFAAGVHACSQLRNSEGAVSSACKALEVSNAGTALQEHKGDYGSGSLTALEVEQWGGAVGGVGARIIIMPHTPVFALNTPFIYDFGLLESQYCFSLEDLGSNTEAASAAVEAAPHDKRQGGEILSELTHYLPGPPASCHTGAGMREFSSAGTRGGAPLGGTALQEHKGDYGSGSLTALEVEQWGGAMGGFGARSSSMPYTSPTFTLKAFTTPLTYDFGLLESQYGFSLEDLGSNTEAAASAAVECAPYGKHQGGEILSELTYYLPGPPASWPAVAGVFVANSGRSGGNRSRSAAAGRWQQGAAGIGMQLGAQPCHRNGLRPMIMWRNLPVGVHSNSSWRSSPAA